MEARLNVELQRLQAATLASAEVSSVEHYLEALGTLAVSLQSVLLSLSCLPQQLLCFIPKAAASQPRGLTGHCGSHALHHNRCKGWHNSSAALAARRRLACMLAMALVAAHASAASRNATWPGSIVALPYKLLHDEIWCSTVTMQCAAAGQRGSTQGKQAPAAANCCRLSSRARRSKILVLTAQTRI